MILPLIVLALMLVFGGIWLIQQDTRRIGAPHLITWGALLLLASLLMGVLQLIAPQPDPDAWFLTAMVEAGSVALALLALGLVAVFTSIPGARTRHLFKFLAGCLGLVLAAAIVWLHVVFYGVVPVLGTIMLCVMAPLLVPAMTLITLWWWETVQRRLYRTPKRREEHELRAVLVLGAGIKEDGTPTRLLARRIDTALETAAELPPETPVVMCGGQGADEPVTEASSMADYAERQGFDRDRILLEEHSTSTEENLVNARKLLTDRDVLSSDRSKNHGVAIVTSDYHVPRAADAMRHTGLRGIAVSAAGHPAYRQSARIREVAAVLTARPFLSITTLLVTLMPALTALLSLVG
ncbi:YdcF family protein [Agrococcus casei]|uniref:Integral membrane protein n=1 Tax=Agrococcus casei LMG 22410 TaxID=1255656 RepID=A0A1R4FMV4_9MICO|nr:YdcF family protein [Agrococcus casei]SJM57153.1 Integral membrane protein [Agrococcus casei LMG 22410]